VQAFIDDRMMSHNNSKELEKGKTW